MKKVTFIFCLALIFSQNILAQFAPNGSYKDITGLEPYTLADFNLKGPVKTVTETNYNNKIGGGYEKGNTLTMNFDKNGKLTAVKNVLLYAGIDMGTVESRYTYDATGKLISQEYPDATGKPSEKRIFIYDSKGNITGEEYTSKEGTTKEAFEYNANNKVTASKSFRAGATKPYVIKTLTYDASGRIITSEYTNQENGSKSKTTYTYEGNSQMPATQKSEGGSSYGIGANSFKRTYTADGDITANNALDASGAALGTYSTGYAYTYDAQKNWTKQTVTGFGAGYTERKIEYHAALTKEAYNKSLQDAMQKTITSFMSVVVMALDKKASVDILNAQIDGIPAIAKADIDKLNKVEDIQGNKAKQYGKETLEYLSAPATLADLKKVVKDPEGNKAIGDAFIKVLTEKGTNLQAEIDKIR